MDTYDIYKFFGFEQSKNIESSETTEEFNEEDIWGAALDAETKPEDFQEDGCNGLDENIVVKKGIKQTSKSHGGNNKRRTHCSSAPVDIPDLCEMIWEERKDIDNFWKKTHGIISDNGNRNDDENGDFDGNMIPPHELIAMRLRRNEIIPLSEIEGVGKTLKCRDAIWTMTGFNG